MHLKILCNKVHACSEFFDDLERKKKWKSVEGGKGFIYSRAMSG